MMDQSLARLVGATGLTVVDAQTISSVASETARRTLRLQLSDGCCVKGRYFASPARAAVAARIHEQHRFAFFPKILGVDDGVMLEQWIDGEVLVAGQIDPRTIEQCGAMLRALHDAEPPDVADLDFTAMDADGALAKLNDNLQRLLAKGCLDEPTAQQLRRLAQEHRPASLITRIVHRDLCAENIVRDRQGRLFCIDNGSLTIGSIEEDLCRVWYRWPMNAAEREAFTAGYGPDRRKMVTPSIFWIICVMVNSARVRSVGSSDEARSILVQLRRHVGAGS